MDELAFLGRLAVGVDDHDLGEGNGAPHRIRMIVEQGRLEIGGAEGLGEPVHRIDVGGREQLAHPPHHRRRQLAAAIGQAAQRQGRRGRPGRLDQLNPEWRNAGQSTDFMTFDRPDDVARREIVERHDRAARRPGRKQLILAIVEAERQHRERAVRRIQVQIGGDADRAEPHIGMAQHHALRPPGGAGRVEQGGEILRVVRRKAPSASAWSNRAALSSSSRIGAGDVAGFERGEPRLAAEQQGCAAVGQDMGDLHPLEQRIDRYMDQAGAGAGEREQAGQPVLGEPARHAIASPKPPRLQRRRRARRPPLPARHNPARPRA